MALRFRKRVRIAPGVTLNFSGSGVSTTIGPRGASVNLGKKGAYLNTGLPGTGLYSRERLDVPAPAPGRRSAPVQEGRAAARSSIWPWVVFAMGVVIVLAIVR